MELALLVISAMNPWTTTARPAPPTLSTPLVKDYARIAPLVLPATPPMVNASLVRTDTG
jgi:hypothetical protein